MTTLSGSPVPVPRPRRTRGAKALVAIGALLLVVGVALMVPGVTNLVRLMPFGVLASGGEPGEDVLATLAVPGALELDLEAGDAVTLWSVHPSGGSAIDPADVAVRDADGRPVDVAGGVEGSMQRSGHTAESLGDVTAPHEGRYTVSVQPVGAEPAGSLRLFVTDAVGTAPFAVGILSGIGLVLAAVACGVLGLLIGVGGAVWWAVVASGQRAARAAAQRAAQPPQPWA